MSDLAATVAGVVAGTVLLVGMGAVVYRACGVVADGIAEAVRILFTLGL